MKTVEVKHLLQRYFDGETTVQEERELEAYFNSGEVADELKEYTGFFSGISELAEVAGEDTIEEDLMEFIRINEPAEKPKQRWMWQTLSGIAASVIIVVGSFLFFQKQEQHFADTFDDPDVAWAYAEQTLSFVSAKYNQGLAAMSNFDKLQSAAEPLQQGVQPIIHYLDMVEKMNIIPDENQ
jgi:hypothetical protein